MNKKTQIIVLLFLSLILCIQWRNSWMLNELYISKAKEIYSGMPLGSIDLQHGDTEIRNGTGLIIPNNFEYYIKVSALKFSQTPIRFIVTSGTVQIGIASLHDKDNDSLAGDVITADKQTVVTPQWTTWYNQPKNCLVISYWYVEHGDCILINIASPDWNELKKIDDDIYYTINLKSLSLFGNASFDWAIQYDTSITN